MTSGLSPLGTALTIIFVISLLALFAQLLFLLWRRRNFRRNIPIRVHENVIEPSEISYSSSSKELLLFLSCLRTQTNLSRVEPDSSPNYPDPEEMELIDLLKLQGMYGPSRSLFTIKEEEREDLESEKFSAEKTKRMSLQDCMKIEEESPETVPEFLVSVSRGEELLKTVPEFPVSVSGGEELSETVPELPV